VADCPEELCRFCSNSDSSSFEDPELPPGMLPCELEAEEELVGACPELVLLLLEDGGTGSFLGPAPS
jgi:hypothetical protein